VEDSLASILASAVAILLSRLVMLVVI